MREIERKRKKEIERYTEENMKECKKPVHLFTYDWRDEFYLPLWSDQNATNVLVEGTRDTGRVRPSLEGVFHTAASLDSREN